MLNRKNKSVYLLFLLCLVALTCVGCKKKEKEIIDSELISEENINVGYSEVTMGDFIDSAAVSAEKVYGMTADLSFPFNEVELEGVYVKTGDEVKQGDLIAKIKTPGQEAIDNYGKSIEEERELYAAVLESFSSRISEKNAMAAGANGYDKAIYQAEAAQIAIEKEQYIYSMEKAIKEMEAELETLKNVTGKECIYAPFDGIIKSAVESEEGYVISSDYVIATIFSAENILFAFDNKPGFKYGAEVVIEAGVGDKRQKIKGKVVAADNIMFEDYHTGRAYVAATEEFSAKDLQNITISGEIMRVNNVLVVDRLAVIPNKEQYGLSVKFEEGTKFRHITLGAMGDEKAWILQGAEEGQSAAIE